MNLILEDWRLKLLAIGLGVLMLGAVAFSQNPPTTGSLAVQVSYTLPGLTPGTTHHYRLVASKTHAAFRIR